jgi:biotin synthase
MKQDSQCSIPSAMVTQDSSVMSTLSPEVIRFDWSIDELESLFQTPLTDLLFRAQTVHRLSFSSSKVQCSTLLSIKTGGCSEDCGYCAQSSRYKTGVEREPLMALDEVLAAAVRAKESGASRFCMGAAWRGPKDNEEFERVLGMVRGVSELGLEVCCTLGMLTEVQAHRLKDAGCHAYNHNLDTSPEFYNSVITTRTYQDRLDTLQRVREAGMTVCCGGILGLGESSRDRLSLLVQLSRQSPHPESVPLNLLVPIEGTPLEKEKQVDPLDFVRMVATTRIVLPRSMVRLSAGRLSMSDELQTLCFVAGANSIFLGDKLLTTPNPESSSDEHLLRRLGLQSSSEDELRI